MIDEQIKVRIRRLFYAEHWRIGTIATELGLHHDTVARAVEVERFMPCRKDGIRVSKLDPYSEFIRQTLERYPRLRASRLFAMIKDRGYQGGIAQLRRFVRTVRPRRAEAYLRLRTLPGEQAQVDWGCFGHIVVGDARRSLNCFVMLLSHSRAIAARFFYNQTMESFIAGHIAAFDAFGGVPRQLLYDNLKSVVVERNGDYVRYHPRILELAGHYHFAPQPCSPYRANEKGKVERAIQYLRSSFFAARDYRNLDDLNAQLAEWIDTVAHRRQVPGQAPQRTVGEALCSERERLLPLPQHCFAGDTVLTVKVGKYPYVRFDLNDYSVPHDRVGRALTVMSTPEIVRIVDPQTNEELAEHLRYYDKGMCIEDRRHISALVREKQKARALTGRDRLRQSCKSADSFIEALALRGGPLGSQCSYLLRLLDRYGATELQAALEEALQWGAISAASVAHILDQRNYARKQPPPLEVVLPDDERVRSIHLTPHELAPYDQLAQISTENKHDPEPKPDQGPEQDFAF